ncbi:DoxX family protein [Nocardioides sp. zg-1228]|uniref:DoxX family protein n=1 Tax=Nocardioides sp. zg-1228 TaxID=2763008 RepID=UPI001642E0CD|nr:DoxX family protein [Nocardioides sp. zg-1228]MBC2932884.1 DoxX family protein [Nocardioides sp. zg-1228]QSF56908.1 DoxX family protein [Nocardioides sp. zg-1228]
MNIALWILTGGLALVFLASGAQKLTRSREELIASGLTFAEDFSDGAVRAIGVLEIMAAAGLILPAAVGLVPVLVPLAAVGLVLLMIGAAVVHLRRGESKAVLVNLGFLMLAALVAAGRFGPESFAS